MYSFFIVAWWQNILPAAWRLGQMWGCGERGERRWGWGVDMGCGAVAQGTWKYILPAAWRRGHQGLVEYIMLVVCGREKRWILHKRKGVKPLRGARKREYYKVRKTRRAVGHDIFGRRGKLGSGVDFFCSLCYYIIDKLLLRRLCYVFLRFKAAQSGRHS